MRAAKLDGLWLLAACAWTVLASTVKRDGPPAPYSVQASQKFQGNDGDWSTFVLNVGTPPQVIYVLVSTASPQTWAVLPQGCPYEECAGERGEIFDYNKSSTWEQQGLYAISTEENLGIYRNGQFGNETITLGFPDSGGVTLENQILGGVVAAEYWMGMFGVNPKPTNWTGFGNGQPSFLTSMKTQNLIPSLSFGYTAGNQYRLKGVLGSLTLGGYDAARLEPNDLVFHFAPDNSRDLVVAIQSISSEVNGTSNQLLPSGIFAYIDSTVTEIWLPIEACEVFEETFGLEWNSTSNIYNLNDTQYEALKATRPDITFTLGDTISGGRTVNITLPYDAFDKLASWLRWDNYPDQTRYFPLHRAQNETQYTLGRVFLQEAYLSVDWESQTFNVSQAVFPEDNSEDIVAISSPSDAASGSSSDTSSSSNSSTSSSNGSTIGIAVGVTIAGVLIILGLAFFIWRRRKSQKKREAERAAELERSQKPASSPTTSTTENFGKRELNTGMEHDIYEAPGNSEARQLDSTPVQSPPNSPSELSASNSWPIEMHSPRGIERHELPVNDRPTNDRSTAPLPRTPVVVVGSDGPDGPDAAHAGADRTAAATDRPACPTPEPLGVSPLPSAGVSPMIESTKTNAGGLNPELASPISLSPRPASPASAPSGGMPSPLEAEDSRAAQRPAAVRMLTMASMSSGPSLPSPGLQEERHELS